MKQRATKKLKQKTDRIRRVLRKAHSMKHLELTMGMMRVIILCWLVPYLTFSIALFWYSKTKTDRQIHNTILTSMENAAKICDINLADVISESKQVSYDGVVRRSYEEYLSSGDEVQMYKQISSYLNNRYRHSTAISSVMLLFREETTKEYYTYSNAAGATYANINFFEENVLEEVQTVAAKLGTGINLIFKSGHLYLVRNMMEGNYTPFATLVIEINIMDMFESLENVVWKQNLLIYLDDELLTNIEFRNKDDMTALQEYAKSHIIKNKNIKKNDVLNVYDKREQIAYFTMPVGKQRLSYIIKMNKAEMLDENNILIYTYIIVALLLIPLLSVTFYYFYTNISRPISQLVSASARIENGEFGYEIEEFDRNEEIGKLINTFNHMSVSLEESFNRIYVEEVAVRDANMQALQSQINPHFLNNTLEIINWKARMSGNRDVSGMVESLGVMMEATMNRANQSFITIREEMTYVDAYLYIIDQRFGNKFQFEKVIDENMFDLKIPRLIVQPLVENMVEHGVDKQGNRVGKLKIFEDERYLHIVVENKGNLTKEDEEKIQILLNTDKKDAGSQNIGIRNVNLRLKLLYGEESGLIISNEAENLTVSEIKIDKMKINLVV